MPPHPLTIFEIQTCYHNEPKFNRVYWKNNLLKIKDGAYAVNLHECRSIGTNWISLYMNTKTVTYLIALELNIFQKKFENTLELKH